MQAIVEKMLNDFERGILSRRQLAATLTGLTATAATMPAALAAPSLKAITLNHVTVRVSDTKGTRIEACMRSATRRRGMEI